MGWWLMEKMDVASWFAMRKWWSPPDVYFLLMYMTLIFTIYLEIDIIFY
jgi:hypothetical protein